MKQQIQSYFQQTFPSRENIQVSNPERITGGWETEIFSFEIDYTNDGVPIHESIIMRMYPSDDAYHKSAKEYTVMKQLFAADYPVPEVYLLERDRSPWEKPFILMERIQGKILWERLDSATPQDQQALLTQYCDLFVKLHQLDWRPFADPARNYLKNRYQFVDALLAQSLDQISDSNLIGFLPVISWLQERRDTMACDHPSLIHFDYHSANVMIRPNRSAVVLDWSGFDVSDTRFDLAWTLILTDAYAGSEARASVLQTYEKILGRPVMHLDNFEVYACIRRLISLAVSIQAGADQMGMISNAVSLMKEQMGAHKRVYELLQKRTGIRINEVEEMFILACSK